MSSSNRASCRSTRHSCGIVEHLGSEQLDVRNIISMEFLGASAGDSCGEILISAKTRADEGGRH